MVLTQGKSRETVHSTEQPLEAHCYRLNHPIKRINRMSQKSLLLLIVVMPALACADGSLSDFLRGTDTTPELSGLQISVMEGGEVTTTYAYGFAQITGTAYEPLRNDHKLRVASISKLIVAIGIMKLVDADALNLDRDVSEYLSWNLRNPNYPQEIITVRQLLSHTSSLRDGDRYFIAYGEGKLRDFFIPSSDFWDDGVHFASGANKAPGHYFVYSNLNFGVLGEVIEQVSGRRFELFFGDADGGRGPSGAELTGLHVEFSRAGGLVVSYVGERVANASVGAAMRDGAAAVLRRVFRLHAAEKLPAEIRPKSADFS